VDSVLPKLLFWGKGFSKTSAEFSRAEEGSGEESVRVLAPHFFLNIGADGKIYLKLLSDSFSKYFFQFLNDVISGYFFVDISLWCYW
jgi:hypothetical protein